MLQVLQIVIDVDDFPIPVVTYLCATEDDVYWNTLLDPSGGSTNYILLEDSSGYIEREEDTGKIEKE